MILVNGSETGLLAASDRGVAYGDGVFRTMAARGGVVRIWPLHHAKLAADCAALGIRPPDEACLSAEVRRACAAESECVVKMIVTAGAGERGYVRRENLEPTRIVLTSAMPKYPQTYAASGVKVRVCGLRLGHQPALAGIKHLNRLENVVARSEWNDPEIAEGLVCDVQGNVIGGTMTNVFIGRSGRLATPALDRCGVAGVTRMRVLEAAAKHGIRCEVTQLVLNDVMTADEVFLVNTLVGVWPVRDLDGQARVAGPLAHSVRRWLQQEEHAPAA